MKIIFFNHYHNGDIHFSREFCKDIMNQIKDAEFYYSHFQNPYITEELCPFISPTQIPLPHEHSSITNTNDYLFVNTWIGQRERHFWRMSNHCGLENNYLMFKELYEILNTNVNTKLKINDSKDFYIPDFNFEKTSGIKDLKTNFTKKPILFCNNYVHSGQAHNFNLNSVIDNISKHFNDEIFFVTNKIENFEFAQPNVFYIDNFNLNQIGYYSTFSKIIIGRSSGPYCFAMNKKTVLNPCVTFIGLGAPHAGELDICWGRRPEGLWFHNLDSDLKSVENTIIYGIDEHNKKHS